ncbi:MAG: molybdenum cofactor biosynthesis protein MoeB, partial [Acidobacteria bacterium]|nr:molybdenum cofactor biosynthesis protein MoeB [Acidobacteriota bacterium]
SMKFRELKLRKNPDCPVCSDNPAQKTLIDYEQFCGIPKQRAEEEKRGALPAITVEDLRDRRARGDDFVLLDVRDPHELEISVLPGSVKIPLGELPARVGELSTADEIVVHCKMGGRSAQAVQFLLDSGFRKVWNVTGGINAWAERIDPSLPKY